MFKGFHSLFLLIFINTAAKGEICLKCRCVFVNKLPEETDNGVNTEISFEFDENQIEPFDYNTTYRSSKKYFYVDCSREENTEEIRNLEWPKLKASGVLANFAHSRWAKFDQFFSGIELELTMLSLYDNQISDLNELMSHKVPDIKMLNLSRNHIEFVKKGSFRELKRLKILDLSNNWIAELEDWAFYGIGLEFLKLSDNQIQNLTPDVFRGLYNLTILDLSNNKLSTLSDEFGNYLPSLSVLSLKNNTFKKPIELPRNLKSLDMRYNELTDLRLSHQNLEFLDVSYNKIFSLEEINFPTLKALKAKHNNMTRLISIKSNRIRVFELSYNYFEKIPDIITTDKLPFLEELYLDGNPINNVSFPTQSVPFSDLRIVSLSHIKPIKRIQGSSFQGLFSRSTHNCKEGNGLSLNLSYNSINYVEKNVFENFSVCSIDLSHNNLRTFSEDVLQWKKMSYINLQGNPWQCDCNIQWMLDNFMVFMYHNNPRLLMDLRCSTPLRYRGRLFVYWYNKTEHVFCNSGPSSFYLDLVGGKTVEIWTINAIVCIILTCIIIVLIIIILVLVCVKPKRRRPVMKSKNKRKYNYKQIKNKKEQQLDNKLIL